MPNDVGKNAQTGTVAEMRPWEKFGAFLRQEAKDNKDLAGDELTANAVDKILTADSEDAIWDADELGLIALKNLVGAEIEIRGFRVLPSSNPEMRNAFGVFALLDVAMLAEFRPLGLQPGDVITVNTGVETIIAKLQAFKARGVTLVRALVQGIPASEGTVVRLRPIPKRAITPADTE